jgi:hypothetical protein
MLAVFGGFHALGFWDEQHPQKYARPYVGETATYSVAATAAKFTSSQASTVPSQSAIATLIVQQSRSAYYATGHPCACPDDLMRNGRRCGASSAYSRPGGASPKCYLGDVSANDIETFLARIIADKPPS